MITKLYIEFFKKNWKTYLLYLITLLYLPINKVLMPHVYGKIATVLKDKNLKSTILRLNNYNAIKKSSLVHTILLLIMCWVGAHILIISSNYLRYNLLPKFTSYIRGSILSEIMDRYKNNYEELKLGDTITKIIKSPRLLEDIFYVSEDFVFTNIIVFLSSFAYLFYYNKSLGLLFILIIMIILCICVVYVKKCTKHAVASEESYDKTHEEIEDTLSNLISVYTSQKIDYEKERLEKLNQGVYTSQREYLYCNNNFRIIYTITFLISIIIMVAYTVYLFKKGSIKLPIFVSVLFINYTLLSALMTIYYDTYSFISIVSRVKIFNDYIDNLPKKTIEKTDNVSISDNITIKFDNVGFYYVENKYILKDFNLVIKENDIVALTGPIGSGKTTIANLLTRLREISSGSIYLNNIEIRDISINKLRDIVNYIPQHPKLFNRTLFENITYGYNKKITEEEILDILKNLNIERIITYFKKNMHVKVGKNGSNLSGGQRQIVWLLRAILKNSKIIILDEPTSSLDKESKEHVIKFINKYSKNRILIIVTHDDSILKYVNRVIKLKDGVIEQDINV